MLVELLLLVIVLLLPWVFYKWATLNYDFFERRNIKFVKPKFLVGNTGGAFFNKYTATEFSNKLYRTFPDESIYGSFEFRSPQYIVRDPELIKQITLKDFDHFEHRRGFGETFFDNLWSNILISKQGEKWHNMRSTLSPAFTGSKMRQMFELVTDCAIDFVDHFVKQNQSSIGVEVKDVVSRYTNDVIATCAFGLKVNSLAEPDNEFYANGKKLMEFTSFGKAVKGFILMKLPFVAKVLNITFTDKAVAKQFRDTILNTMEIRKEKNIHRPDMINILMQIRDGTLKRPVDEKNVENEGFATVKESDYDRAAVSHIWTDDEIVAQCFGFFIGSFDTSSTLLTFAAYELAVNPNVQQKLYEEIREMNRQISPQRLSYDAIQKMKYLDQVVSETLRKWPPLPQTDRVCIKDYVINNGCSQLRIDKGGCVLIQIYCIHNDPKYFPDPDRFDPERFSDENKGNITPGTYLAFGSGPRNCIASRFALMKIKSLLYYLLLHFSLEPNEKTQIPLKLKKVALSLQSDDGVQLNLHPR